MAQQLKLERKYIVEIAPCKHIPMLYRGRGDLPGLARDWPHKFIAPLPLEASAKISDSILSIRIRKNGFIIKGETIVPVADAPG